MNKLFLRSFVLIVTLLSVFSNSSVAQTWIASSSMTISSGGYDGGGGTYYRATNGSAATFSTGLANCNGSTATVQMGSSLFIFRPTVAITGITLHGNSGTGSTRILATTNPIQTSTTLTGTYTAVSTASATGNLSGSQATNVCSPNPMVISFGTTIAAGTYIRVALSGNAYIATITLAPSCTAPTTKTVSGTAAICSGSSTNITLTASQAGVTYDLYKEGISQADTKLGDGNDLNWPVSAIGNYTVKTTSTGGYCVADMTGTAAITAKANPAISSVTAPASSICPDATQLLTANDVAGTGAVVNWFTETNGGGSQIGTNTSTITAGPGTYYARVTGDCAPAAEAFITVNALALPLILTEDLPGDTYIQGNPANPLSITASGGGTITYQWFRSVDNTVDTLVDTKVGTNSNSYTPSTTAIETYYYYVVVYGCSPPDISNVSGAIVTDAPTNPTIVPDETGFSGSFGNQPVNTNSAPRFFGVNGSNLTEDILITAPSGFEVSLSSGSGYAGSVSLTQSGGNVTDATVYVHFAPTSAGAQPGNIQLTSAGADPKNVAVSGTGIIPSISLGNSADMNFNVNGWATSTSQSTSVTGTDLVGDIDVSVGVPFEVSTTGSGGWGTNVSYTPLSGSVNGTLYVRYNPLSGSGDNTGVVTLSSSNATNQSINVAGKAAPVIILNSGSTNQNVKAGIPIGNIEYTVTGGVTSASASPLPSGVTYNSGTNTISGTPGTEAVYPALYSYTVTIVGPPGTSNATASGTITVKDPDAKRVAYVTAVATPTGQQLYNELVNHYEVTVYHTTNASGGTNNTAAYMDGIVAANPDLIVLHESVPSATLSARRLGFYIGQIPILNTKAHMYGIAGTSWPAGAGNNGTTANKSVTVNAGFENHPIFSGVTFDGNSVTMAGNTNGIIRWVSGATTTNQRVIANNSAGTAGLISIMENDVRLTGLTTKKYMLICLSAANEDLTSDGLLVLKNACDHLMAQSVFATAGPNGTISSAGETNVPTGGSKTYTITPDANYHIESVTVDGAPVALSDYTFSNVTANHTIAVTFEMDAPATTTWQGTDGASWNVPGNWSNGVPDGSADVIIDNGYPLLDVDFTIPSGKSLTISGTGALVVAAGKTLSVTGSADFGGKSVTFKSDANGTANLGQVAGTLTGASNVTVERYIPNNNFRSWRLLSVPVTSSQTIRQAWQEGDMNPNPKDNNVANYGTQITGVFNTQAAAAAAGFDSTSVQAAMLRWNGTGWSNITSTNQPINNFNSYFLYIRGDRSLTVTGQSNSSSATTLRTKGTVYTGDQTTNVGAGAFALVPNVYPSAINFTGLTRTGGVNNLFYIWDSKKLSGSSLGTYQTFSSTNSFNCLIAGGSYTLGQPNTVIESGQSFFVTSGAAGTVVLKESAKTNGTNGSLGFRPAGVKRKIDTRLYNSGNEMLDATAVVFDAVYSKAVADEDAPKLGNPGANFAIETDGKLLAIAGTQPVKENDAIQFRMWNIGQGDYTLEFVASNINLANGMDAMLEDSYLKTSTDISLSEATKVKFTVNQNAGSSAANRFKIVFARVKPLITGGEQGYSIAPNPVENSVVKLAFKNQPAGKYGVRILSASGQLICQKVINHPGGNITQNIGLPVMVGKGACTVEIVNPVGKKATQTALLK